MSEISALHSSSPKESNGFGKILKLTIPMAISNLVSFMVNVVGVLMLARLSHESLAASALITSVQTTLLVVSMGILFSISIVVGHAFGAKKHLEIGGIVQQGWILALCLSVLVMITMLFVKPILIFLGQQPQLVDLVQQYFSAYLWGVPALFLLSCNIQFCLGILRRQVVLVFSLLNLAFLSFFAYGLIFGKLGFPALGIAGLGYAGVIQNWLVLIICMVYFYNHSKFKPFGLFRWKNFSSFGLMKRLFAIGWPISVQMAGELLSFFVATIMTGWLGSVALAARQISWQYLMIIVMPLFALTQAVGILVGHAMGSKNFQAIRSTGNKAIGLGVIFSLMILIIFISIPKTLISFFVDVNNPANQGLISLTAILFIIIAIGQVFDAIRNIGTGALRGLFDTRFPMFIGLICLWGIAIPLGYILAFPLKQGLIGLSLGFTISILGGAIVVWQRWLTMSKSLTPEQR